MQVCLVFAISLHCALSFRLKVNTVKPLDVDPFDDGTHACLTSGRCTRLVLSLSHPPIVEKDSSVTLHFDSCARQSRAPLQRRYWYKQGAVALVFRKGKDSSGLKWFTRDLAGVPHSIEMINIVRVDESQLNGAHHYMNETRPFLGGTRGGIGELSAEDLVKEMSMEKVTNISNLELTPGERVDFLVDLKLVSETGRAMCPPVDMMGNFAYSTGDNLKLMVFASGEPCNSLAKDSPAGTEHYCLNPNGDDLRGWLVVVNLGDSKPVVRNPALEEHNAWTGNPKTFPASVKRLDKEFVPRDRLLPLFEKGNRARGHIEAQCRFLSYSPEQWLANGAGNLIKRSAVVINTNFYLFADIQRVPCGTPIGPVVSEGQLVQSMRQTMHDMKHAHWKPDFELLKAQHVLVMYKGLGAFVIRANSFDQWFSSLSKEQAANVNAVTGHKILRMGRPVDQSRDFRKIGQDAFWNKKYSRTVIGIQYEGMCPLPGPNGQAVQQVLCGNSLLLLQFEKKSQGKTIVSFFSNSSINPEDRPPSDGVTIPEVQDILQYMMVDEALNFDGSGSSALWTSIGDFSEKRAQPSDVLPGDKYQFRPSPILLSFEPRLRTNWVR